MRRIMPAPRHWTRRGSLTGVAVLLLAAFSLIGLAQVRIETTLGSFLPSDDPSVAQLDDKARSYGGDPIVVLLESPNPRQLLGTDQVKSLVKLEGQLATTPNVASVYGPGTTLNQITGRAQDLLAELTGRRDGMRNQATQEAGDHGASPAEAQAAGQRAQQGFDQRYGALIVQAAPAGLPTLTNQRFIDSLIYNQDGGIRAQWHTAVPSENSVAVLVRPREGMGSAATASLVDRVRTMAGEAGTGASKITVSGAPVVASSIGEQISQEVPLIGGIAVLSVGAVFLLVPWTALRRRLLPLVITLVSIALTLAVFGWAGWTLSLGAVAFLSVLLGVGSYYPTYFMQHSRRRAVLAVACASSASLAMLTLSPLPFVRDLGLSLSVGVLISAMVSGLLLRGSTARPEPPSDAQRPPRHKRAMISAGAVAAAAAVLGWASLSTLPLQTDIQTLATGLNSLGDAKKVERAVGSSGEVDLVVRGPDVTSPEGMDWMRRAQDEVVRRHGDQLRPILSLPSLVGYLGPGATREQIGGALRLLPDYLGSAVVRPDRTSSVLVFGVRLNDIGAVRALRDDLERGLPPAPPQYRVELTGLPMAAVRGEELISQGRLWSNILGIATAGAVLAAGLRRRSDAARAVATAVVSTGLGLFVLWATGSALNPITVALGSLTSAVGCEFTVMLAESRRTGNRSLRRSIVLAAGTSAIGYATLAVSELAVVRQFGLLLAGSVGLALVSAAGVVWATTRRQDDRSVEEVRDERRSGEIQPVG